MTIKKQFICLATIIITIPLLCCIYIFIHNYIRSEERVLIREYNELKNNSENLFSKEEWKNIKNHILSIPSEVQELFLTEDGTVLLSSFPEIKKNSSLINNEIISFIKSTSKTYYYQFSSLNLDNMNYALITRIPRQKKAFEKKLPIIPSLLVFLVIVVFFCTFFIIKIFKNISNSITTLEKQTLNIANGELNTSIKQNNKRLNEISSISNSIEKMRHALVEAQNQKNKFIMGISHDLRTPVAIIKGYTEALSDKVINKDEINDTYNLILSKTNQLESMIDTLINYMKMNNIEIREQLKMNNLSKFIKNFSKDTQLSASVFKRVFEININIPEDIYVPFNEQLISRALENIFSNAIRYTKEGDKIYIKSYKKDNYIYYQISDTGKGIDKKDLPNIFDIFYRGTNSRREEGIGIGLSVVKNIIDTHEWNISVESEINIGTKFTIKIPISKNQFPEETD